MYVYSLGVTLSTATAIQCGCSDGSSLLGSQDTTSSGLKQLLLAMAAQDPTHRPTLQSITKIAGEQVQEEGIIKINALVTQYLFGSTHDVSVLLCMQ